MELLPSDTACVLRCGDKVVDHIKSYTALRAFHINRDRLLLNGRMFTGRDSVHAYLMKNDPPVDLNGGVIYHCGPVAVKDGDKWKMNAAGPTTSIREEPYQAKVIADYGIRGVIGKGGMGAKTLKACKEHGCVYLHAIGGLAAILAQRVTRVETVLHYDEFGPPEAMWVLQVEDFPAVVTMDSHGESLHEAVDAKSHERLQALFG